MIRHINLFVLLLITLSIGCSEGSISPIPEGFNDKEFATISPNLRHIKLVQEKLISEIEGMDNFVGINFNSSMSLNDNRRGKASYNVSILDGFITAEWSSNIVETYTFEVAIIVDGERVTSDERGIAVVATPKGIDYDYGERIPYYFACFQYPDEFSLTLDFSCSLINQEYLFYKSWENESFLISRSSMGYSFSNTVLNLAEYDYSRGVYVFLGDDFAVGSGEIATLF